MDCEIIDTPEGRIVRRLGTGLFAKRNRHMDAEAAGAVSGTLVSFAMQFFREMYSRRLRKLSRIILKSNGRSDDLNARKLRKLLRHARRDRDSVTEKGILEFVNRNPELKRHLAEDLKAELEFSQDCRSGRWGQELYEFSPTQAAVMKLLYRDWKNGCPSIAQHTLLDAVGSNAKQLRDLFRNHPSFNVLVIKGASGTWRLAPPSPHES